MVVEEHMAELPLEGVGARLRRAREATGKSRADFAAITKISERLLAALEDGNYAALPARAYATGFARSYARTLGLDAEAIVRDVRNELDGAPAFSDRPASNSFEPGDPARIPSRRLAWIAASLAVLLLAGLAGWRMMAQRSEGLPSILPPDAPATRAPPPHVAAPAPAPEPTGPVVITAHAADVWVRITDGGRVLLQKNLVQGESFAVPVDAVDPRLRTGRPDALDLTIGGRPVPRLAEKQMLVSDVPVSANALRARSAPSSIAPASLPAASMPPATTAAVAISGPTVRPSIPRARPVPSPLATPGPATTDAPAAAAASGNPSTVAQ